MTRLQTREVAAAAYLGPNKGRTMLSHSCLIGSTGAILRVLCDRVSPLSIADYHAQDTTADPTCRSCLSKRKKWLVLDLARRLEERLDDGHFGGATNRGLLREAISALRGEEA